MDDDKIVRSSRKKNKKHHKKEKGRGGESSRGHHAQAQVNDSTQVQDSQKEEKEDLQVGSVSPIVPPPRHHRHVKNDNEHKPKDSHAGSSKNQRHLNDKAAQENSSKATETLDPKITRPHDEQRSPTPRRHFDDYRSVQGARRRSARVFLFTQPESAVDKAEKRSSEVERSKKPGKIDGRQSSGSEERPGNIEIPSTRTGSVFDDAKSKRDESGTDSEEREWTGPEQYEGERDDEWLKTDRAQVLRNTEKVHEHHVFLSESSKMELGCAEFMESMKYFWWWLRIGGRMPFQMYAEDRIIKFSLNKRSLPFAYYAISSAFLTLCTTSMAFSLVRIVLIPSDRIVNLYQRVEQLEVDKYWLYVLVTLIYCMISSSVSLATMFEDGFILADYLTRWNLAISTVKYRPTRGLRLHFWIKSWWFAIYAIVLIYLFHTKPDDPYHVPAVRGAAGLIGTVMALPFLPQARFRPYFPHLEKLGLFVHLYSAYSSKAILLMVTLYCQTLDNMARRWNIRLAYVLGTLGHDARTEKLVAVISFQKLFVEHTIIVGFLRHTGRIFAVGLGIFYSLKFLELVLLSYRTMTYLIFPLPKFNGTIVPGTPSYLDPITYTDAPGLLVGTVMIMLILGALEWFILTYQISICGDTILDGYSFVRRFGLILSKTTQRRRFVQSLNHAFSSASDYYVKATYTINREFMFNMFFWLVSLCALLTAFHPLQLQKDIVTVCGESGNCVVIQRTRIAWQSARGGAGSSKADITRAAEENIEAIILATFTTVQEITTRDKLTTPTTTTLLTTTLTTTTTTPTTKTTTPTTKATTPTTKTTTPTTKTTTRTTMTTTPTTKTTTRTTMTTTPTTKTTTPTTKTTTPTTTTTTPTTTTTTPTTTTTTIRPPSRNQCNGMFTRDGKTTSVKVDIPNLCERSGLPYQPYGTIGTRSRCLKDKTDVRLPFERNPFDGFDCNDVTKTTPFPRGSRDSCGNIPLPNFRNGHLAIQTPVFFPMPGRVDRGTVVCCYDYENTPDQLERCNQPFSVGEKNCNLRNPPATAGLNYAFSELEDGILVNCFKRSVSPVVKIPERTCGGRYRDIFTCLCGNKPTRNIQRFPNKGKPDRLFVTCT